MYVEFTLAGEHGTLPGLPPPRLRVLWRGARQGDDRQPEGRACWTIRLGCERPLQSALPGLRRPLRLHARGLPGAQGQRKRARGKRGGLRQEELPGRPGHPLLWRHQSRPPANWLDTVANVRIHGETHTKPLDLFAQEKPLLRPLPALPYDCAVVRPTSRQRLLPRRSSTPIATPCPTSTPPSNSPSRSIPINCCSYHQEKLIATHLRSYDRRQDIHNPDHIQELLAQRQQARDQTCFAGLPEPETAGRTLRPQAAGKAPQRPAPHPEDRRLERNLRPRQSAPRPAGRPDLRSLRLRIHRQPPGTTRAPRRSRPRPCT